jgi:hypothetical protein
MSLQYLRCRLGHVIVHETERHAIVELHASVISPVGLPLFDGRKNRDISASGTNITDGRLGLGHLWYRRHGYFFLLLNFF